MLSSHAGISPKLQDKITALLTAKGVEIVCGERVEGIEAATTTLLQDPATTKTLKTNKGRELVSDYQCMWRRIVWGWGWGFLPSHLRMSYLSLSHSPPPPRYVHRVQCSPPGSP